MYIKKMIEDYVPERELSAYYAGFYISWQLIYVSLHWDYSVIKL